MKIALLQFAPDVGTVQANIKKADQLLQQSKLPLDLDWLILPEMAFSGYNFHSLEEITPYLEPTTAGISTQWAVQVANHYNCHVTVGYPERTTDPTPINYNSTVTVSPSGTILANYRKSFLYYTDETWAAEPSNRFSITTLGSLGPVIQGICMDINPYRFTAPWSDYEFATAALQPAPFPQGSNANMSLGQRPSEYNNPHNPHNPVTLPAPEGRNDHESGGGTASNNPLIVLSMAWLSYLTPSEIAGEASSPDVATVAYWVERFQPIVERSKQEPGKPWYVVLSNRCGIEKSVCYAGSSTVVKIESGDVTLFETCGRGEEKIIVIDLDSAPKFSVKSGR